LNKYGKKIAVVRNGKQQFLYIIYEIKNMLKSYRKAIEKCKK
jgi:hypothetical protein